MEVSISLFPAKFYFPSARQNLVPRPRLVERLNFGLKGTLTLVSAPAGFGKTSLLSEWRMEAGSGTSVAWLSLDDGDNDLARFWLYLITALEVLQHTTFDTTRYLLQTPQPVPPEAIISSILHELESVPSDQVLVLDDFHAITSPEIQRILAFLLDHWPPKLHLVILTRADPPFPLARLRARNQLTEIRAADLRFTVDEVAAFLSRTMGLHLTHEQIVLLEARTEGWIAGLQLAALSMQRRDDVEDFVASFTGGHHYVLDYLVEEVLNLQSETMRDFLLKTSILERMNASLCNVLTGKSDGQSMLEELEQTNLFVVRLDDERRWYRYHLLFADVMQNRLRQTYPSQLSELHIRAAEWYEQNGLISEAVSHAFASQDRDLAAKLLEKNAWSMIMRGELVPLINWGRAVGASAYKFPWLCIYQAWALNLTGQVEDVETWLRRAEGCLEGIPAPDDLRKGRAGWGYIATICAHLALLRNDAPRAIQLCQQAFEDLNEEDIATRGGTAFLLGNARLIGGDLENVNSAWAEAARLGKASGSLLLTTTSLDGLTYLAIVRGDLRKAESICREELRIATSSRGKPLPLATHALARLASLQYERNELGVALSNAETSVELSRILAKPNYIIQSHDVLARLRLAQGDLSGALALLYEVEQVAERYALTPVADSLLAAMKMRLWIAKGDLKLGEQLAKERAIEAGKNFNHMRESEYPLYVRILCLQGNTGDALALQTQILQEFESFGWQGRVIETLVLRSLILQASGNLSEALDALEKALLLAESEGYMRVFLEEGVTMADLLRRVGSRGVAPRYVAKLLAQSEKGSGRTAAEKQPLIEPLSEREIEVLSLLAVGLSNQNIAERLFISIGTVKAHTASIYRKLDVNSRMQAIARSKDLGLL